MVNGAFYFSSGAVDLTFQRTDAALQLGDGQAIEILAQQGRQGIVGPGPQDIVQVHDDNVDRRRCEVNKAARALRRTGGCR